MARILDRGIDSAEILIDANCKNKFRWEWLETNVEGEILSTNIRKVNKEGKVKCIVCDKLVNYGSRGKVAIADHVKSDDHKKRVNLVKTNTKLPASLTGGVSEKDKNYGIHPMFKNLFIYLFSPFILENYLVKLFF